MNEYGRQNIVEYNKVQQYNKREGWSQTRIWRGDYNQLANQANILTTQDSQSLANVRLSQNDPQDWAELQADYKLDYLTTWTLDYVQLDQSIFYCPVFLSLLINNPYGVSGPLSNTELNFIVQGLIYAKQYQLSIADLQTALRGYTYYAQFALAYGKLSAGQQTIVQDVLNEYNRGNDVFPFMQSVLNKTWLVTDYKNNTIPFNLHTGYYNNIMTLANLTTYFGPIPDAFVQLIPTGGYWFILPARSEMLNNGKFAFTQQYQYTDQYSSVAYTIAP